MEFKPDVDRVFERLEAWWRGETLHPVNLAVLAPRQGVTPRRVPAPGSVEQQWTDIDYVIDKRLAVLESTAFMGDAIPGMRLGLGPSFMTATLGCPLNFMPETSWTDPAIGDWGNFDAFPDYRLNRWYKMSVEMMERCAEAARGRCLALMPDLHPGGDGLASLRGNENFLMDIYDHPDRLRWALDHLDRMFVEMVETYYRISISRGQRGSSGFLTWGAGKTFPVQDDTLALVSPDTARELLLPSIRRQARSLDHVLFHLDGPEALDKLDMLLETPEIHGIQWTPGAAHLEMTQWIPLMRKVLAAGRLFYTQCRPYEVEPILKQVPSRGLRLLVMAESEDQGRRLLEMAADLTH